MCGEIIKIKYESEGVNAEYKSLKARLSNMEQLILELKNRLVASIKLSEGI